VKASVNGRTPAS